MHHMSYYVYLKCTTDERARSKSGEGVLRRMCSGWRGRRGAGLLPTCLLFTLAAGQLDVSGSGPEPEFLLPLDNLTVAQGRDVHFTCIVNHLANYKVAWIKSDTKTILAIHTLMVTQNSRLSVTHNGHNTWKLYVHNVQTADSGTYMCQINTDPMKSQMGHLTVVVPPDIRDAGGAAAVAAEGGVVELACTASGEPAPVISWRRVGGRHIVLRDRTGAEIQVVETYSGSRLRLAHVRRADMGQYHCIASNGVPPTQSKRYDVTVLFRPSVRAATTLVQAALGGAATLACYVEASPRSLNTWQHAQLQRRAAGALSEAPLGDYTVRMNLTLTRLRDVDFGDYTCGASNALGSGEDVVRLREIKPPPTTSTTSTSTTSTSTTTPPPPALTTPRPRKKIKPKLESGAAHNSIGAEERAPADNSSALEHGRRGDRVKVRPSGPPRYVVYSAAPPAPGALAAPLALLVAAVAARAA